MSSAIYCADFSSELLVTVQVPAKAHVLQLLCQRFRWIPPDGSFSRPARRPGFYTGFRDVTEPTRAIFRAFLRGTDDRDVT